MKIKFIVFLSLSLAFNALLAQTVATPSNQQEATNVDYQINAAIKEKISADSTLKNSTLTVTTSNGIVKLSGNLNSVDELTLATQIAQSTPGVNDVDTSQVIITNGNNQPFTDALITSKIKGMYIQKKLFTDNDVAAMSISVGTKNGIVTLSGSADNPNQIDNAIKIAKSINGVKEVKSTVIVKH